MNRIRKMACIFILLYVSLLITTDRSDAQQTKSHVLTFEALGYRGDSRAAGVSSELRYDFVIPRSWEPAQPTINLHFSHSSLLLPDLSLMTIFYNELPITDVRLTAENARDSWLEIEVPPTALKEGRHTLKIVFDQHISDDHCDDHRAPPALWSTIHKDSTIAFKTKESIAVDLASFPEPFSIYGRPAVKPIALTVVLPTEPDEAEWRAAGLALAKLGQLAGVRELDLSVRLGEIPAKGHVFVIARQENALKIVDNPTMLPLKLNHAGFVGPDSIIVPEDEGVIQLAERADGSGLLLLSGESDLALTRAALALADSNSLNLMSGPFTIVKELPQQSYPPDPIPWSTSLEGLTGAGNQRIAGIRIDELQYCFRLPQNWEVGADAMLDLNFSYSPSLWAERSSLAVLLNTATLTSLKLNTLRQAQGTANEAEAGQGQVSVPIPAGELIDGYNCLRFVFTLRLQQIGCAIERGGEAWAEIDATSPIVLPHTIAEQNRWLPNMSQYPYPFNLDPDLANTSIILPDSPTISEIEGALELASKLGNEARHDTLQLQLKTANSWQPADQKRHLILIGGAQASADLESALLELAEPNDSTMNLRKDIILRQQSGAGVAAAELLNSPWDNERGILHISGHNEDTLSAMFELLSSNRTEQELKGNIVTITEEGMVRTVDTLNRPPRPTDIEVGPDGAVTLIEKQDPATISWFLIGAAVLLGQILLTAIGLTIRDRRRQPKKATFIQSPDPEAEAQAQAQAQAQAPVGRLPKQFLNALKKTFTGAGRRSKTQTSDSSEGAALSSDEPADQDANESAPLIPPQGDSHFRK